jgi:glycosyltransferase involved in cell wall biosynthesis
MSSTVETVFMPIDDDASLRSMKKATDVVSVIVPCYNEERYIVRALEKLADQYDKEHYEIVIVDGRSDDGTRALIEKFKADRPDVTVVLIDNPARAIPAALNLGIAAARGNIIARMDAHATPSEGYIRRCIEVLRQGKAGIVGMPCRVQPGADTLTAQAIANGVSHPFGIGDATYRLDRGTSPQEAVDTVAFACFRKSLWQELGGYNEMLLTNEDYDFNYRARMTGAPVVLDRQGHCDYFARTKLSDLAKQYVRYGGWKARMVRLHPRSLKPRHLVAPLFVVSILMLGMLGFLWVPFWLLLGFEIALYLLLALAFGWAIARRKAGGIGLWLMMPLVFATIHLAWGSSFLLGLIKKPR